MERIKNVAFKIPLQMLYQSFEGANFHGLSHSKTKYTGTDSLEETEQNNPDDSATDIKSNLMTSARLIFA